ncbi:hypothetical protein HDU85_000496 [Gaertneriomyces sp. JEL0708]|nr:hypothetical protein HDU85_000496 [Gaertneriomyces sp. JEL0708]
MAPTPKEKSQRGICLITGYGPFRGFPVNPSYESVRHLQARKFRSGDNQEVFCKVLEVPVEYERVHGTSPT